MRLFSIRHRAVERGTLARLRFNGAVGSKVARSRLNKVRAFVLQFYLEFVIVAVIGRRESHEIGDFRYDAESIEPKIEIVVIAKEQSSGALGEASHGSILAFQTFTHRASLIEHAQRRELCGF